MLYFVGCKEQLLSGGLHLVWFPPSMCFSNFQFRHLRSHIFQQLGKGIACLDPEARNNEGCQKIPNFDVTSAYFPSRPINIAFGKNNNSALSHEHGYSLGIPNFQTVPTSRQCLFWLYIYIHFVLLNQYSKQTINEYAYQLIGHCLYIYIYLSFGPPKN